MNILIMLFLISLLVLVHELGHFLATRAFGIQVSRFGFGLPIGPTLFEKKIGDTIVSIHAFILGGYVSFPDDDEEEENPELPLDSPKRFKNKKPWQKAIVVVAGVFSNLVFALVLVLLAASLYHKLPSGKYDVYFKSFAPSADETVLKSGLKPQDKIVKVNDISIDSTYQFIYVVQKSKFYDNFVDLALVDDKLSELKKLNGEEIKEGIKIKLPKLTPEKPLQLDKKVLMGLEKFKTDEVELNDLQKKLRNEISGKNEIVYDGKFTLQDLAYALADTYKPIKIEVLRDNKPIVFNDLKTNKEGLLGISLETSEVFVNVKSPKQVMSASWNYLYENTKLMVLGLWQLVCGKIPLSDMHGIVAITKVGGDIIEHYGMLKGLLLAAIISVDLAIINLLPIPALDGGHLMFLALEKITGRELNEKIVENISRFFFALLILLMIFVVFNDIFALVTNKL